MALRLCAVSWYDRDYMFDPGMKQMQEALSFDEGDAEVHRVAGALHLYRGDHEQGIRHLERAVELNPSDAYLLATSAIYWAYYGEPRNGLKHMDRAMKLDPFLPAWCVEDHGALLYALAGLWRCDHFAAEARHAQPSARSPISPPRRWPTDRPKRHATPSGASSSCLRISRSISCSSFPITAAQATGTSCG